MLNGLSRRLRGGVAVADGPSDLLIGDQAQAIVPCPSCARPLARGQGRCPGCGTLLIAGVRLQAAGFLVLVGVMLGMIGGALVAGAAMAPRLAAGDAAVAELAAARPVPDRPATVSPGVGGGAGGAAPAPAAPAPAAPAPAAPAPAAGLPDGTAGGLLQVAAVNTRLAEATIALGAMLAAPRPRSAEVAALIRRVAADSRAGADAARRLGRWDPAALLAADAAAFYAGIAATATDGLAAPLADRAAYAAAGRAMLGALEGLPGIAAETGEVAALAGVELLDAANAP